MLDGNVQAAFSAGVSFLQTDSFFDPVSRYTNPNMSAIWGTSPFVLPITVGISSGSVAQVGGPSFAQQVFIADYAFTPRMISRTALVFTLRLPIVPSLWTIQSSVEVILYTASGTSVVGSQLISLGNSDINATKTIDISITPQNVDTVRVFFLVGGTGPGLPASNLAGFSIETTQFYIWETSTPPPEHESGVVEILAQPVTTKTCLTVGQASRSDIL